jgi:hypothetical protein
VRCKRRLLTLSGHSCWDNVIIFIMRPYLAGSVVVVMTWARKRMRFGSWLALSALAIQLALSFGHIHAEDFASTAGFQATVDADQDGSIPAQTDHPGLGHYGCDICATISLLATLVIPSPPVLTLLVAQSIAPFDTVHSGRRIGAVTRLFQARAPPNA